MLLISPLQICMTGNLFLVVGNMQCPKLHCVQEPCVLRILLPLLTLLTLRLNLEDGSTDASFVLADIFRTLRQQRATESSQVEQCLGLVTDRG
jgi:hypothetical protein